jgi:hypothetical protein
MDNPKTQNEDKLNNKNNTENKKDEQHESAKKPAVCPCVRVGKCSF